jgi:hypothetical protein
MISFLPMRATLTAPRGVSTMMSALPSRMM